MRTTLASIVGAAIAIGCTQKEEERADDAEPGALTYLALGDSYTIGEGVEIGERWPVVLAPAEGRGRSQLTPPGCRGRSHP